MRRIPSLAVIAIAACASSPAAAPTRRFEQKIPGTSISIAMLPVPPGDHPKVHLSATEVPWEAYDSFVFGFDKKDASLPKGVDAVARPSQPYITMDHSFGHAGYPAISISSNGADAFCAWLSAATGRKYRLPTEAEWEAAARADGAKPDLDAAAWTKENASAKTHPIGSKAANAWGFHDMVGNAAEWCTAPDGAKVVRGGCYLDPRDGALESRKPSDPAWNRSDPQVPKSKWWLANGDFIGFRVACEE
jgi:formylglycine-generating enzyme required for sulfatase activity